jgi:hypothetical protein
MSGEPHWDLQSLETQYRSLRHVMMPLLKPGGKSAQMTPRKNNRDLQCLAYPPNGVEESTFLKQGPICMENVRAEHHVAIGGHGVAQACEMQQTAEIALSVGLEGVPVFWSWCCNRIVCKAGPLYSCGGWSIQVLETAYPQGVSHHPKPGHDLEDWCGYFHTLLATGSKGSSKGDVKGRNKSDAQHGIQRTGTDVFRLLNR